MSFRLKIVLWFSLALLITLIAFHIVTVEVVRMMVYDEMDSSLEAALVRVEDILATHKAQQVRDDAIRQELQEHSNLNPRKEFISIWHADGTPYFNSRNLEGESLPRVDSLPEPTTLKQFRNIDIRLIGKTSGEYVLVIGYSLADAESAIRNIMFSANVILPVSVILAFVGGLLLVGRLVRPIEQVNKFLAAAATHPLSRDLPHLDTKMNDEIGELSRRVTEAVGKTRTSMRWILSYSSLVPHQLRTPVTVMRSQLENVMQERTTRAQLQQAVASTYDEVLKLNSNIENLLALGKLQAGTLRLQMQKLRIRSFLEGFREEAAPLAGCKDIQFVMEEGPDIPLTADMQWIRQSLFNLLDNAIRHTPEGGKISMRYAIDGAKVEIQISDTGEGIPAGEIPLLFEPFYQGEYRDRNAPGAGLGLVLVKLIATAHRGTVHVASIPGKGTTFTLSLPLRAEQEPSELDELNH